MTIQFTDFGQPNLTGLFQNFANALDQQRQAAIRQQLANQEMDLRRSEFGLQQDKFNREKALDDAGLKAFETLGIGGTADAGPTRTLADSGRAVPQLPTFARGDIGTAITTAANKYGVDPRYLMKTAQIESGGDPNARNPSGATGLFQFMPATARQYGVDPTNPISSADGAARLAADNAAYLREALGRDPTPGELYLAHQQGAKGAAMLLTNPDAPAKSIVGNAAVQQNGGRPWMTARDFATQWTSKFDTPPEAPPQPYDVAQAGNGPVPVPQPRPADLGQPQAAPAAPDVPGATEAPARGTVDPFANVPPKLKAALPALLASPRMRGVAEMILQRYPSVQPNYQVETRGGVTYLVDTTRPNAVFRAPEALQDPYGPITAAAAAQKAAREADYPMLGEFEEAKRRGLVSADMQLTDYARLKQQNPVTITNTQEKAGAGKLGTQFAERYEGYQTEGNLAQETLGTIQLLKQAAADPSFYSGFAGEAATGLKQAFASLGISAKDNATANELFDALGRDLTRGKLGGKLGAGVSDSDVRFLSGAGTQLSKTVPGNMVMLDIAGALQDRKMKIADLASDYADKHGGQLDIGWDSYLRNWARANPLFDDKFIERAKEAAKGPAVPKPPAAKSDLGIKSVEPPPDL